MHNTVFKLLKTRNLRAGKRPVPPAIFVLILGICAFGFSHCVSAQGESAKLDWRAQSSGVKVSLRGLSVADENVAWASGANGIVIRTLDGGESWANVSVAAGKSLDFRDIEAWKDRDAVVLSAGSPAVAYRTNDGGQHWQEVFRDTRPEIFFDAMSFVDGVGMAFGDPIEGRLILMRTEDHGRTWELADFDSCPKTSPMEAGFAASGTGMIRLEDHCWIGLGGGPEEPSVDSTETARVLRSQDGGKSWSSFDTPIRRSASRGLFSVAFFDPNHGIAVGGDYMQPDDRMDVAIFTSDGGATWQSPAKGDGPSGYRSCVAVVPNSTASVSVGRNGTDFSLDRGQKWTRVSDEAYQAVAVTNSGRFAWAVGADGRVARANLNDLIGLKKPSEK